ncbi:MAG: Zn-ribbon domain-containing OB-fold protein [Actinomycetes bacterium]
MDGLQQVTLAPQTDPDTGWWWEALAAGSLLLPRCRSCELHFFPPMPSCPRCGGIDIDHREASGVGTVSSWVVVHHATDPLFVGETPYTIVAVHLAEGPRLFGRIANGPLADGMAVRAVPYTVDDITLLGFVRA